MPQVTVAINGRSYTIACEPGEEDRVRQLGRSIDAKVVGFAKDAPQAGEARLLVMAALMLADELSEARETLRRARGASNGPAAGLDEEALASGIERLALRIETVAARLEATQL
ncbi:MAG TPA: cell division protein ZapA [Stellaceae bacterium]|jgi:cell division protein ZapA|nr:cell division protein ZapA [Stellaceae bacterium]